MASLDPGVHHWIRKLPLMQVTNFEALAITAHLKKGCCASVAICLYVRSFVHLIVGSSVRSFVRLLSCSVTRSFVRSFVCL